MRITGGELKGYRLAPVGGLALRPSSDKLRARLFNILHTRRLNLKQMAVLDVFAGSGSLGLECLSRGAGLAAFVEQHKGACMLIARNAERLGVTKQCWILRRDATRLGKRPKHLPPFALALLDPPYGLPIWLAALQRLYQGGWLAPKALCVIEAGAHTNAPITRLPIADGLDGEWRDFGDTRLGLFAF